MAYNINSCLLKMIWSKHMPIAWWRHQMETVSALLALCAGNSPVTGEFPAQRPVTRIFDVFFDLCLNKRLSKQSWGWWFKTPPRPLWRHCNDFQIDTNVGISILRWHLDNHGGWVPKITKLTVINLGQIIIWYSLTPNCNLLQNDQNTCISNHNLALNTLTVN